MDEKILIKMSATENCVGFRTITPTQKSPRCFYITRDCIMGLKTSGEAVRRDGGSFAELWLRKNAGTVRIRFTWLSGNNCRITGREEMVTLPYEELLNFMERSSQPGGPKEWSVLSMKNEGRPRLVFCGKENLHAALENRTVRRKLVRFLRDNFQWADSDEIRFYNDFVAYSFFFRDICNGKQRMCGALILHGQEDLDKAYYSIHT